MDDSSKKLYKYVTFDVLMRIVKECCFMVSSPARCDDPWECRAGIMLRPLIEKKAEKWLALIDQDLTGTYGGLPSEKKSRIRDEFVNSVLLSHPMEDSKHYQAIQKRFNTSAIFCLSEVNNSAPLWAQYGDFNKGAVIEIDLSISKKLDSWLWAARQVCYSDTAARDFETAIFTKSPDWSYQKEWRVVIPDLLNDNESCKLELFDPSEIKSIILGVNTTKEQSQNLSIVLKSSKLSHVKLYKMGVHVYRYEYIPSAVEF